MAEVLRCLARRASRLPRAGGAGGGQLDGKIAVTGAAAAGGQVDGRRVVTGLSGGATERPFLRGVVFDMDGTLTKPNLDFAEMHRRAGVALDADVIRETQKMPLEQRAKAEAAIEEIERAKAEAAIEEIEEEGRRTLQFMPGAVELGRWLGQHGIPIALVTRNSSKTAEYLQDMWVAAGAPRFEPLISRDSDLPPKPDPAAIGVIAHAWDQAPGRELVMVGDSVTHDVGFGRAAGVTTVLLDTGRAQKESKQGTAGPLEPDLVLTDLHAFAREAFARFEFDGRFGSDQQLKKYSAPEPTSATAKSAVAGDVRSIKDMPLSSLSAPDRFGNSALIWAAEAGQVQVMEALLKRLGAFEKGARLAGRKNSIIRRVLDAPGYVGNTALSRACRRGHAEVVRLLLAAGANPDLCNSKLQYPMHFAAFQQHKEVVRVLLDGGASTYVLDRKGRTPAEDTRCPDIRAAIHAARTGATARL
eukprot:g25625.t1